MSDRFAWYFQNGITNPETGEEKESFYFTHNVFSENTKSSLFPYLETLLQKLNVKTFTKMKSSLKFCVIAAGEYDGYVAEPRACEWDIAAGHAILVHAGGSVKDFENNKILYGKKDFKNPSLVLKSKSLL